MNDNGNDEVNFERRQELQEFKSMENTLFDRVFKDAAGKIVREHPSFYLAIEDKYSVLE
jgi:hypothetical protein